ncbi:hypothetical protein RHMOL_Rhmol10G0262700 [Rhododendron molle]|uniref:Uncharacterized protein n=1 Tax=Rhododendron molle TaxID=49168 RepID=A0ACC0M7F3_RHOML|nr:hypothetical protein RHMOL_Rhmol10G0262700 [Rhododendron molle]
MDRLANMSVNQEDKMVSHVILPDDIIPLLKADMRMRGVAFEHYQLIFLISSGPKKKEEEEEERQPPPNISINPGVFRLFRIISSTNKEF